MVLATAAACGGGGQATDNPEIDAGTGQPDAEQQETPAFRNPVDMEDEALGLAALQLLGANVDGATGSCGNCHGLTQTTIRAWRGLTNYSLDTCITDEEISSPESAHQMVECFRNASGVFTPRRLGVLSTGTGLPWFETLFERDSASPDYEDFEARAKMPPTGFFPFDQSEFDIVVEWFARGTPFLNELLPEGPVGECEPLIDARVAEIVDDTTATGWRQRNADADLAMFGCAGAATALDCLTSETNAASTAYGDTWAIGGSTVRVLATIPSTTAYWSRSSADGRFFASGQGVPGGGSSIIDLDDNQQINVTDAAYDPAFFPDNSGWVFQGGGGNNVCAQSALLTAGANFSMSGSPACSTLNNVGLYQHVGRATSAGGAGDYFSVSGNYSNDNFGHSYTGGQPSAPWDNSENVYLTPMVFNGTTFEQRDPTAISIPQDGDMVLSENAGMMLGRLSSGGGSSHIGYQLYALDKTANGDGSYDVDAPVIARYCETGGKPAFSFDDRYIAYHHYYENTDKDAQLAGFDDAADPGYADYTTAGASDIFVIELATGLRTRITAMAPGQYALYPHFRSDGWLYFLVRDNNSGKEYAAASDRVLRIE
jgi:hypothetical protein